MIGTKEGVGIEARAVGDKKVVMESRAHFSKTYTSQGQKSRIMQDLESYSENFRCHLKHQSTTISNNGPTIANKMSRNLHVGIVGAGLAGLRCAEILVQGGINVTIVEARDRLGGRVSSQGIQRELQHL